jgi:hypothetical protein
MPIDTGRWSQVIEMLPCDDVSSATEFELHCFLLLVISVEDPEVYPFRFFEVNHPFDAVDSG